jgi:hypothetical protein
MSIENLKTYGTLHLLSLRLLLLALDVPSAALLEAIVILWQVTDSYLP